VLEPAAVSACLPRSPARRGTLGLMNSSENLMLSGVAATCPDCGDERILVEVEELDFCCTTCDAAVLLSRAAS
jgi:uncharacterized protein (DUF983 family)